MERAHVIAKLLVLAGVTLSYTSAQEVNSACRLKNGGRGVCQGLQSCPEVLARLHREQPVVCSFRGREPIVCCPTSGGPVQDISPPAVSFECGIQSERTVFGALSRSRRQLSSNQQFPGKDSITVPPVVGGEDARVNAWPWMALLGRKDTTGPVDWFCAGMLINEQWVVTAAHCLLRTPNVIRLGEHDYSTTADGANHEDFSIATTITYPDYSRPQAYHDIGLIKLNKRVAIKSHIRPACLPWGAKSSVDLVGRRVTVTGWGLTQPGGRVSSVLQEVRVTVFPSAQCDQDYKKDRFYDQLWPQGIGSETLCAGDRSGGKDACQGDSGGPAVYADGSGRFTLAGIISTGNGCGQKDFPGLYTNVQRPPYLAWIREVAF